MHEMKVTAIRPIYEYIVAFMNLLLSYFHLTFLEGNMYHIRVYIDLSCTGRAYGSYSTVEISCSYEHRVITAMQ
jgi:hypothetical protein